MEVPHEKEKANTKLIYNLLIFLSLIAISIIICCIFSEIKCAKKECNELGGEYKIDFSLKHYCNGERFVKYRECIGRDCEIKWNFESYVDYEINLSEFLSNNLYKNYYSNNS